MIGFDLVVEKWYCSFIPVRRGESVLRAKRSDFGDSNRGGDAADDDPRFSLQVEGLLISDSRISAHLLNLQSNFSLQSKEKGLVASTSG